MRIAVLTDIHGNLNALNAILAELENEAIEHLAILGDLAAFGPHPADSIERILSLGDSWHGAQVTVIGGNTDRYLVTGERRPTHLHIGPDDDILALADEFHHRDQAFNWGTSQLSYSHYNYLRSLIGQESHIDLEDGGRLLLYHGSPGDDEGWIVADTPDDAWVFEVFDELDGTVGIGGHTHIPMDRVWGDWLLLNAGSVGAAKTASRAEYLILDSQPDGLGLDFRTVNYDVQATIDAQYASGNPVAGWCVEKMGLNPI